MDEYLAFFIIALLFMLLLTSLAIGAFIGNKYCGYGVEKYVTFVKRWRICLKIQLWLLGILSSIFFLYLLF